MALPFEAPQLFRGLKSAPMPKEEPKPAEKPPSRVVEVEQAKPTEVEIETRLLQADKEAELKRKQDESWGKIQAVEAKLKEDGQIFVEKKQEMIAGGMSSKDADKKLLPLWRELEHAANREKQKIWREAFPLGGEKPSETIPPAETPKTASQEPLGATKEGEAIQSTTEAPKIEPAPSGEAIGAREVNPPKTFAEKQARMKEETLPQGAGAANVKEFEPVKKTEVKLGQKGINKVQGERGEELFEKAEAIGMGETAREANDKYSPEYAGALMAKAEAGNALNTVEQVVLHRHRMELNNELNKAYKALDEARAAGNKANADQALFRIADLDVQLNRAGGTHFKARSESGRALQIGNLIMDEEFSPVVLENKWRKINKNEPLPPEERQMINKASADLKAKQAELDAALAEGDTGEVIRSKEEGLKKVKELDTKARELNKKKEAGTEKALANIKKQRDEIIKKIRTGDYSEKPKAVKVKDPRVIKAKAELDALKRSFAMQMAAKSWDKMTFWQKAGAVWDAYRYQNMLSGPQSQARNIYGNAFQLALVRPAEMSMEQLIDLGRGDFSDKARIPKYYVDLATSLPKSMSDAMNAFKEGAVDPKIMDIAKGGGDAAVQAAKIQGVPKVFTLVTRFMNAADIFNRSMFETARAAELERQGTTPEEAMAQARLEGERILFREKISDLAKDETRSVAERFLGQVGTSIMGWRNWKIGGSVVSHAVPFVTTPVNIGAAQVAHSPLGFLVAPKNMTKAQAAKALSGTLVMGVGTALAATGNTNWSNPKDEKQRTLGYAAERKPYSVKIGNTWVPMVFFGPYALALAIPAAIKHYMTESKTALTDDFVTKATRAVADTMGFITRQTSLQGASNFLEAMQGDPDKSLMGSLAFTATQALPLSGLQRYMNRILDPVYRKAPGFKEMIQRDILLMSKYLEPYKDPDGKVSVRKWYNSALPYEIGVVGEKAQKYEGAYQREKTRLQKRADANAKKKRSRK